MKRFLIHAAGRARPKLLGIALRSHETGAGAPRLRVTDQEAVDRYVVVMQDPQGNDFPFT
jgi:hypothetical protein